MAVGRIKGRCSFELSRDGGARGIEGSSRVANGENGGEGSSQRGGEGRERVESSGPREGDWPRGSGAALPSALLGVARMEPTRAGG